MARKPLPLMIAVVASLLVTRCANQDAPKIRNLDEKKPAKTAGATSETAELPTPAACRDNEHKLGLADGSQIRWVVIKKKDNGVPVIGVHPLAAKIFVAGDEPLKDAHLELDIDGSGPTTGLELRDERLAKYVFDLTGSPRIHFTLMDIKTGDGSWKLPEPGATTRLALHGTLEIGPIKSGVTIPVLLQSLPEGGYRVSEGLKGIAFDVRKDLGLGERVDALMALVNTTMEDTLRLHFDLTLTDACPR